jgi:endonuclease YncB( thermonuclease family)
MAWFGVFRRTTGMNPFSIRPHLIFATVFSLLPVFAFAGFTGPVVSVLDGDTIEVLHNTTGTMPVISASNPHVSTLN